MRRQGVKVYETQLHQKRHYFLPQCRGSISQKESKMEAPKTQKRSKKGAIQSGLPKAKKDPKIDPGRQKGPGREKGSKMEPLKTQTNPKMEPRSIATHQMKACQLVPRPPPKPLEGVLKDTSSSSLKAFFRHQDDVGLIRRSAHLV